MEIKNKITPAVLSAAVAMLQQYIPELSPVELVAALKNHRTEKEPGPQQAKPMTRQEAAALLSVSLNTVDRYLKNGLLKKIKIGDRIVRIDPASVRKLLEDQTAAVSKAAALLVANIMEG